MIQWRDHYHLAPKSGSSVSFTWQVSLLFPRGSLGRCKSFREMPDFGLFWFYFVREQLLMQWCVPNSWEWQFTLEWTDQSRVHSSKAIVKEFTFDLLYNDTLWFISFLAFNFIRIASIFAYNIRFPQIFWSSTASFF